VSKAPKRKRHADEAASRPSATAAWISRAPLVAALVALAVYLPSLGGGFLYDDGEVVVRNSSIRDLRALGTVLRYEPSRPVLNLTWALNYAAGGLAPWTYHLVNVLIHAANAAVLASLLAWIAGRHRTRFDPRAALAGACLFAASPMAAETVAYVSSRSSALVTLFSLLCLRQMAGVLDGSARARLLPALGCFLLALATKEEAAAVPLLILLLDFFFVSDQRPSEMRGRAWIHGLFFGLIVVGLVARRMVAGSWLPEPDIPIGEYLLTQWAAFPLYFFRLVLPLDPAFYRNHLPSPWPPDVPTVAFGLLTVALLVIAVRQRRAWPEWAFAVLALGAGLLPSSSVVALQEMVVDHRAYLGSVGVAFALGVLLVRKGGLRLVFVVVALWAARSLHYEWVLADPVRAWEDAIRRIPPSGDALCALGEEYAARDDPRAEALFQEATKLNPTNERYWANLGLYYSQRGRHAEAAPALQAALREAPDDAVLRDYLGQVLLTLGRDEEARVELEAAIAAQPDLALAHINLAAVFLRRGEAERARRLLEHARTLPTEPDEAERLEALWRLLP
jgi:hypothetical protein